MFYTKKHFTVNGFTWKFSAIFDKGDNFPVGFIVHQSPTLKRKNLLPRGVNSFPFRADSFSEGCKNNFNRVVSLERVSSLSGPNFRRHLSSAFFFFFLTNCRLERSLKVKLKD